MFFSMQKRTIAINHQEIRENEVNSLKLNNLASINLRKIHMPLIKKIKREHEALIMIKDLRQQDQQSLDSINCNN